MSNWHDVAVLAESFEQQAMAAIKDYGPMSGDEQAQALLGQATFAFRRLHNYAEGKLVQQAIAEVPVAQSQIRLQTVGDVPGMFALFVGIAGVDCDVFRTKSRAAELVAARCAISWVLRHGVKYRVLPSWPDLAIAVGAPGHATLITASYRAMDTPNLIRKMLDACDAHGIATHPRPDWAKEAA
jgi:hypothetical protein